MLPIDRTTKASLDANLVNGNTSDAPVIKNSNDVVYNTIDELYNFTSGLVAGGALQPYPHGLNRQALINGNFDVWIRGTSFTNPNGVGLYTADRWMVSYDGSGMVHTVSQQAFITGQTSVPNNPTYFYRRQVTTPATGQTYHNIGQRIENVNNFSGQKVTISFWAKADAARNLGIFTEQNFGGGGSASVFTPTMTAGLTTTWQKFAFTFNLGSISGKTLGTNHFIAVAFGLPLNTLLTIDIAQVQVNAGDIVLPFQPRSFADELALCHRYYEQSWSYGSIITSAGALYSIATSATLAAGFRYKVQKRISTPTVTIFSPTGTSGKVWSSADVDVSSGVVPGNPGDSGVRYVNATGGGLTVNTGVTYHYSCDAEL